MSERHIQGYTPDRIRSLLHLTRANIKCDQSFARFAQAAFMLEFSGAMLSGMAWIYRPDAVALTVPGFLGCLATGSIGATIYYSVRERLEEQKLRKLRRLAKRRGVYTG